MALSLSPCGCAHVAGNYPSAIRSPVQAAAKICGEGFQLLAGSALPLEQAEAELGQLRSQGFSRRDPQIIRSVAKRKNIPPALLADNSDCTYFRFRVHLDPGTALTLMPGALEVTLQVRGKTTVVRDQGYLLEDRSFPGGCRPPSHATLAFGSSDLGAPLAADFLVRLPGKGKIVGLDLIPPRCDVVRGPGVW